MNYQQTLDWMFSQLPMYQQKGAAAYKTDLDNTILLSNHLKNPEHQFKSVHIAGTNGKGSTSHMLSSVMQEAGYKVGLYTSPHLKDFRERIKIDSQDIEEDYIINFISENKSFFSKNELSFFEMTVGLAFSYFRDQKVDIAIIEVVLGGRLDSTNIINPEVSVITNIGLDHTQFLGNNLADIAKEKAGIIKPNTPVIIGEEQAETIEIFRTIAQKNNSKISIASNLKTDTTSDLKGLYQKNNIKTVISTIKTLNSNSYWNISEVNIKTGLSNVVKNTNLMGRWQIAQDNPKIILDTAHNKEGLKYTIEQLKQEVKGDLYFVLGMVKDKNTDDITSLLPKGAYYLACKPNIPRGLEVNILANSLKAQELKHLILDSVSEAIAEAIRIAKPEDTIYIGGSTFVVAEALIYLEV